MWRSVFLHEFLDHRIANFQALKGQATPASLTLQLTNHVVPGVNSVGVGPGVGFQYVLATPLQQIIGISCRVRLKFPTNLPPQLTGSPITIFPIVGVGGPGAGLALEKHHDYPGTRARAIGWIGTSAQNLGVITLSEQSFVDLRFDWHTSGQAHLLINGRLVGYHNAVAPGALLTADRVWFGIPEGPLVPVTYCHVSRVFIRALQRPDALGHLAKLLPAVPATPLENRCRHRIVANVLSVVDRLRQFMQLIHQTLSQPWSEAAGPSAGPFKPDAVRVHALATTAVAELVRMLRSNDFKEPDKFLEPFTEFLRILAATQPQQFKALATDLDNMDVVPDDCREALDQATKDSRDAFVPIIELLTEAADRVRLIAGEI